MRRLFDDDRRCGRSRGDGVVGGTLGLDHERRVRSNGNGLWCQLGRGLLVSPFMMFAVFLRLHGFSGA
jgi:hypothetical protein